MANRPWLIWLALVVAWTVSPGLGPGRPRLLDCRSGGKWQAATLLQPSLAELAARDNESGGSLAVPQVPLWPVQSTLLSLSFYLFIHYYSFLFSPLFSPFTIHSFSSFSQHYSLNHSTIQQKNKLIHQLKILYKLLNFFKK